LTVSKGEALDNPEEPYVVSWLGYRTGNLAPGVQIPDVGAYNAAHNLIRSHAEAWNTYDTEFRPIQNGNGNPPSRSAFCTMSYSLCRYIQFQIS